MNTAEYLIKRLEELGIKESGLEKLPKFYGVEIYKNNIDDVDIANIVIKTKKLRFFLNGSVLNND